VGRFYKSPYMKNLYCKSFEKTPSKRPEPQKRPVILKLYAEKYMIENVYPADMIYVVEEYLKKHPLSTWQNEFKNDEQELS
jgi:hypothetical protein